MRIFLVSVILINACWAGPIVETNYGKVEGIEYEGAEVFLAIPFAKPPVDDLRFEKPVAPDPWEDVYPATQYRNDCTPHYRLVAQFSSYSGEDCLTLNIIKPKKAEKLPVLFWIHGGGYEIGSASQHGYEFFAKRYASQGVIVATVQYRLGFMGFFSEGTSDVQGNWGLFDQAAALEFVKSNIENFGGDPNQITIWGYSAGAASVSQLTMSPYTRDSYSKAIIMSASSFVGWATGPNVVETSKQLAEILGCPWPGAKECMKKKSLHEIFDAIEVQGWTTGTIDILRWSPVIDGDFMTKNPEELIKESPVKPTLIGMSNKEGSYFAALNMGRVIADFGLSPEDMPKVDEEFISEIIGRKLLYNNRYGENREKVWNDILDFYVKQGKPAEVKDLNGFYVDRYSELLSDITFNVPILREITSRVERKTPVWTYRMDHYDKNIWKKHIPEQARGSPHANEYHYLFDMPVMAKIDMKKEPDSWIQNDLIDMVISFAKTGVPQIEDVEWRPVSDPDDVNFLNIRSDGVSIEHGLFQEPLAFWNELRQREGFDLIDPTNSAMHSSNKDEL
ncbi:Gut esterase 1 [Caenorhabditis elegans]|uniref:Gut esterase 1 n=1 Tax=Caenorhabditis elegans TaxID=6239 RepID=EST1_CAEEL|nr:Gut esterase 1 [Caenorhabditis elegans]Q04457.1 RecName: Full=Gut esterase 1; AltName: Full=Non-specific carboxylesterase; Flags: Precursor [Caenorhabditis elegans]AAA28057.1 elastase [Caenorhabditis elegans]CCD68892.1 Gut esterase 1 [Caenorhabditis elegans]|eukprot:NP_503411.1 Gut esterase 1 [Caenorhabditis elegans]